jgi:phosphatidylinositol alpha-1,6-mannosyltransferase
LPGHLLASLGPAGNAAAIALLLAAGAALVASLIIAPPRTPAEAAKRIALGLTALFALSPATRFGYFCYPLALYGWVALAGYRARGVKLQTPPPAEPGPPAGIGYQAAVGVR